MEFLPQSVKNAFSFLPPDLLGPFPLSYDSLALLISPPFNPPPPPPPLFPVTFAANSAQKKGNRPTEEDFFPLSLLLYQLCRREEEGRAVVRYGICPPFDIICSPVTKIKACI